MANSNHTFIQCELYKNVQLLGKNQFPFPIATPKPNATGSKTKRPKKRKKIKRKKKEGLDRTN